MTSSRGPVRAGVVAAVGFLGLDAVLLVLAGAWTERPSLVIWGAVFGVLAAVPVVLWRRYLKDMDDVRDARRAMADEARRLQAALRDPPKSARGEPRR
jgi:hypothetical protein